MSSLSLEVVEGRSAGRVIPLAGALELGREPGAGGVALDDALVSRRHLRIAPADGGAVLEDLGSRNGTFVNGNEVHSPTRLTPGDQVLVGSTVLELRSAEQIARQPSRVVAVPPALASPERKPEFVPAALEASGSIAPRPQGGSPQQQGHVLDRYLDVRTKTKAKLAPLAILLLVVFAVLIFLATR